MYFPPAQKGRGKLKICKVCDKLEYHYSGSKQCKECNKK